MNYLFLLLVSISTATGPATPPVAETALAASPAAEEPRLVDQSSLAVRGSDLIFSDGFESGGEEAWGELPPLFSGTTTEPEINFPTCDLPPGTYTFRVAADNLEGGVVHEYTMTVAATLCGVWPCFDISFSDPVITFR